MASRAEVQPPDVSEEELIALAIAASLSDCAASSSAHCPPSHTAAVGSPTGGGGFLGNASTRAATDLAVEPGWVTLGPSTASPPKAGPGAWGKGAPRTSSISQAQEAPAQLPSAAGIMRCSVSKRCGYLPLVPKTTNANSLTLHRCRRRRSCGIARGGLGWGRAAAAAKEM